MKNVQCRTQAELDAALKDPSVWPELVGDGEFEISGSSQVRASGSSQVRASGSSQVTAYDSSQVTAYGSSQVTAYDSSQVTAYDSSQVTAYGSSQVRASGSSQVTAYGSSQVRASDSSQVRASGSSQVRASGSSQVTAYGSSQVRASGSSQVRASGSSQVTAYDSSQVTASKYVAVTKNGNRVKATGGVQINYIPPQNLAEWMEEYSIQVTDGVAIVYKAVGSDFKSQRGEYYTPGTTPECDRWDTSVECGGGLHVCGTPHHALGFYVEAKRFVALPVVVDSIAHWPNGDYPTKVKVPRVVAPGCYEVDINGKRI